MKKGRTRFIYIALSGALIISAGMLGCSEFYKGRKEVTAAQEKKETVAQAAVAQAPAKARVSFQEAASKLFEQPAGPDDSGDVYNSGLTATYTGPAKTVPGEGKYGKLFYFLPVIRWYDPEHYYSSAESITKGTFKSDECILCHTVQTPGIVAQWKRSKHAKPEEWKEEHKGHEHTEEPVTCDKCHGTDHENLTMPSYNTCGKCHEEQVKGHRAGEVGSHTHAFHINTIEAASWQIGKPGEEVTGCAACHGTAENRCDGCHTRHEFSEAEARRPNNCGVCHTGLDHYEYEMYTQSYHGKIYEAEGATWDWTKPLKPQNYKTPTCAYCHMQGGEHNVMKSSTTYSHMGTALVDRGATRHKEKREGWINVCKGCHSPRFAKDQLEAMDEAVKVSFTKWREAMAIVTDLYQDGLLDPMPKDLAPDWAGHYTFSLFPGGEGRMFNVSEVERISFEMLVYITNAVYKASAHFAWYNATYGLGAFCQDRWLIQVKAEASRLRRFAEIEKKLGIQHTAYDFWKHGEYTDLLLGWKRKPGDVAEAEKSSHH